MPKVERRETPLYILHGILESGKTTVIRDFLDSNEFTDADRNLLILCEEGEEEIDEALLAKSHTQVVVLDDEASLTTKVLEDLDKKFEPTMVLLEMNYMWDVPKFMKMQIPACWFEYQDIGCVDASTYEVYSKNMKDKFRDLLTYSDVLVYNRCDKKTRQQDLRRNARVLNPKVRVYFESEDPNFVQEPPELPYSLKNNPIYIPFEYYGAFIADVQEHPEHYDGKRIKTQGFIGAAEVGTERRQVFGRMGMACCADDMMFMGFKATGDCFKKLNAKKRQRVWGEAEGKVKLTVNDNGELNGMYMEVEQFKPLPDPEDAVVYFN